MRALLIGLVLLLVLVIQATLVPLIAINGVRPDVLLIIVVSVALLLGKEHGAGLGFFAGLLQDLASGNIFGLNILSKLATGYFAGVMERKVFKENVLLPILAVAVATVFNSLIMLLMMAVLGFSIDLPSALINIVYVVIYNAVFAIPVHKFSCRVYRNWLAN